MELGLTDNAIQVLRRRYLVKSETGEVIESPEQMFQRVARHVADGDTLDVARFYEMMTRRDFLPNTPCIANAGRPGGTDMLSACFVLPVEDSMLSIFETLKQTALIFQSGGGVGFNFSRLRPEGDFVRSTTGTASGPLSFMAIYDAAIERIKQGSMRRGAAMGMLRVDHPDILKFINAKRDLKALTNFNVSVAITDAFMDALARDGEYELINPRTSSAAGHLHASEVWDRIIASAHHGGEPGLFFVDRVNKLDPIAEAVGPIEACNPCFTGDTRIATQFGLVPIAELARRCSQLRVSTDARVSSAFAIKDGCGVAVRDAVPAFKTHDAAEVFRVETRHGYRVTATGYHKFVTPDGFAELHDLHVGDVLLLQSGEGQWGDALDDPGIGAVLGWATGDGCWESDADERLSLRFYDKKKPLADDMLPICQRLADRVPAVNGHAYSLSVADGVKAREIKSTRLRRLLAEHGMTREAKLRVPDAIFSASRDTVRAYLRYLFAADGQVNSSGSESSNTCSVRLSQSNPDLLRDVQMLLLNFGIVSSLYKRRDAQYRRLPDGRGGYKEYWCETQFDLAIAKENLSRFADVIGFARVEHAERYEAWAGNRKRDPYRESFEDEIISIEYAGTEPVYCTTQPSHHTVIANGIVTGQCGEVPLHPNDSCNLASINLSNFVADGEIDWQRLASTVKDVVRFLDNVITVNRFPLEVIRKTTDAGRKIGLGVMGWADMLIKLGVRYDSDAAIALANKTMGFVNTQAILASEELAQTRGAFPLWPQSKWAKAGCKPRRNATVTVVAPTGSVSLIAGCSSGIEPLFALAMTRKQAGLTMTDVNPLFVEVAKREGWHTDEIMAQVTSKGTCTGIEGIPNRWQEVFRTAGEITPEWHVKMQAAFQRHVELAVSKTVNAPHDATVADVDRAYRLAWELGCKGITVYRDKSRDGQTLSMGAASVSTPTSTVSPTPAASTPVSSPPTPNTPWPTTERRSTSRRIHGCRRRRGETLSKATAYGTVHVTVNYHPADNAPFECFILLGKSGQEVRAMTEALGRVISYTLTIPSAIPPKDRLLAIAEQFAGIGGGGQAGFGEGKVMSAPDAIGQVIRELMEDGEPSPVSPDDTDPPPAANSGGDGGSAIEAKSGSKNGKNGKSNGHNHRPIVDFCPDCHQPTLMKGKCDLCSACGFSKC